MNTESFVGPLHKQKEVLEEEQQILLFTEFTWQDNMDINLEKAFLLKEIQD